MRRTPKTRMRGRKSAKLNVYEKLERSRQSARECRARKKLRYQYVEELVASRERAVFELRKELDSLLKWTHAVDRGETPENLLDHLEADKIKRLEQDSNSETSDYIYQHRRMNMITTETIATTESMATSHFVNSDSETSP